MPERFARRGDVHADMVEHAFDLTPVLELADRHAHDRDLGDLPYPPDHPKMPGEPPRVQPSRAREK